jgi:hypothetical protein
MHSFIAKGGQVVEVTDDDHWLVNVILPSKQERLQLNFTRIPAEVRPWWRSILAEALQRCSCAQAMGFYYSALWFTRFQKRRGLLTQALDSLESSDWKSYAEWLRIQRGQWQRPLSVKSCRNYFFSFIAIARLAITLRIPGTSYLTTDRLSHLKRSMFKGQAGEAHQRLEQRALSSEQYTDLYDVMAEEWQRYQEREEHPATFVDLPALVGCWLAFNDGLRPVEINMLTLDDVQADPLYGNHQLRVRAPNKAPDSIPIEKDTLLLLQALIDEGAEARRILGTDRLFVGRGRRGPPRILTSLYLNRAIPCMIRRHKCTSLPDDLKLPDGRITFGTHLTREINNRERVRRLMRHVWASTTERYYRAEQKVVVAGNIAKALRAEALRLTIACQRPITHISERPEHIDILARNPGNAELEYGSCGRDVERQGSCRMAKHCFECPLLVPWVSKRHNYVAERDEYLERAQKAENTRDRENLLYHASLAEAYITLIDRCRKEKTHDGQQSLPSRQRRPRKAS